MIVDFKYHIASLVAVFMALGVGIIMGSTVLGESLVRNIVAEQELLVSRLEEDYAGLKAELNASRQELKKHQKVIEDYRRYAEKTLPHLVKNRLKGKKIAFVVHPFAEKSGAELLRNGLELAGANLILDLSLAEVCAGLEAKELNTSSAYSLDDAYSVAELETIVLCGQGKEDEEFLTKIKECRIPVYTYQAEPDKNKDDACARISTLVELVFQMAQEGARTGL
ncbi:MAG TPA: copper transporter [Peptococcaceae bacterium]|nr:copper transporter [Peptococcaceae bacterium]HQD53573.1 copper transporter [Peptococcaceae bacterium]